MTHGFENHTPEQASIEISGIRRDIVTREETMHEIGRIDLFDSFAGDYLVVSITGSPHGGYLTKREAIYLRNRLTAFIEKGIGDEDGL